MLRSLMIISLFPFTAITNSNAQIVALGASSTAGYGVGASSAYPAQLEEILRARGRPISVSNAATRAASCGEPPTPDDGAYDLANAANTIAFDDGDRDRAACG